MACSNKQSVKKSSLGKEMEKNLNSHLHFQTNRNSKGRKKSFTWVFLSKHAKYDLICSFLFVLVCSVFTCADYYERFFDNDFYSFVKLMHR